jgi:hypothetical protein
LRHYDLIDEQKIAEIEHWDSSAMLDAADSAGRGRSYESLPKIWRELLRAYRQGRWVVYREASRYMADECLRIGLPQEAAFHAVVALNSDCVKQIGKLLLESRDASVVEATVVKLLLTANLQRHFVIACELIQITADLIPDCLVERVLDWVLLRGASIDAPDVFQSVETTAWKTIESLAARATSDTAERIVKSAIAHRAWSEKTEMPNQFIRVREEIVDAVNEVVTVLPIDILQILTDATIPLATERRNFKDFDSVLSLLSHLAHRGTQDLKNKIRSALYPPGQPIPPALLQASPFFGYEILNEDGRLEKYATHIVQSIGQVVQHVPKGETPKSVDGTVMTWSAEKENETLVVHLVSTQGVWGLIQNRNQVPEESRRAVIVALLAAISDPDNRLENRISFINCLRGFSDCMDASLADAVFRVLAPIARGNVATSSDITSSESQSERLNRFRFNEPSTEQVVAQAIYVLGCIEHKCPGRYGARLQAIVRAGLSSESPEIRKSAFAAVREIPAIAEATWMPLLLGTRDPDPNAASLAFDAISTKQGAGLTRALWKMAAYSLKIAQISTSIELRKAASKAVSHLELQAPNRAIRVDLSAIHKLFADDIAYCVRKAAKQTELLEIA